MDNTWVNLLSNSYKCPAGVRLTVWSTLLTEQCPAGIHLTIWSTLLIEQCPASVHLTIWSTLFIEQCPADVHLTIWYTPLIEQCPAGVHLTIWSSLFIEQCPADVLLTIWYTPLIEQCPAGVQLVFIWQSGPHCHVELVFISLSLMILDPRPSIPACLVTFHTRAESSTQTFSYVFGVWILNLFCLPTITKIWNNGIMFQFISLCVCVRYPFSFADKRKNNIIVVDVVVVVHDVVVLFLWGGGRFVCLFVFVLFCFVFLQILKHLYFHLSV